MNFPAFLVAFLALLPALVTAEDLPLDRIRLPAGFSIELLARVPNARQMTLGDGNILYVGSFRAGKVYAVPLDYKTIEKNALSRWIRWRPGYGGYYLAVSTRDLNACFALEARNQA